MKKAKRFHFDKMSDVIKERRRICLFKTRLSRDCFRIATTVPGLDTL